MMRVLLFGSSGMLGQAIKKTLSSQSGIELSCAAREHANFTFDFLDDKAVEDCLREVQPDIVINAAAIVNLQQCEDLPLLAYQVNSRFCSVLSEHCKMHGSYLVQVSTDHYYAGDGDVRHGEDAPVILLNEYARTKYAGECFARAYPHSIVLRTNIIGFRGNPKRPTFLEWAIGCMKRGETMTLFHDFYTSSIHVGQFASILGDILKTQPEGIYNLASSSVSSKADFLEKLSLKLFQRPLKAHRGSVRDMQGCQRAESLGLDTSRLERLLGYRMPDLDEVLESVRQEYEWRKERNEIPHRV